MSKYEALQAVLDRALLQASEGKGKARHAIVDSDFHNQPMQSISRLLQSPEGLRFQAIKKTQESSRMETPAAVDELLGAINYLAGAIIYLESLENL